MAEVTEATSKIYEEVHQDANIILGVIFDETLTEELQVTVIATGIREENNMETLPENVTQFVQARNAAVDKEPAGGSESRSRQAPEGGRTMSGVRRHPFVGGSLDEDLLDEPTFLRRNEN